MRIRLIGRVEVERDDGTTHVRGQVPGALLARLAWTPGDLVTSEQLAADVWPEAPDAAGATLRAHLSRLRTSALGDALVGVRGGYLLDVGPEAVDAVGVREGVARLGGPRADEAHLAVLVELAAALSGHLASGLDGAPFLREARARWATDRLAVEENLGETALALGDNALATAVLEGAVARHPDHERPIRLLATALARSTRTGDATDVIDRFVSDLSDRGVEASARISALRLSIARLEPAVVAPVTGPAPSVIRVGVPVPLTRFVGRDDVMEKLRTARSSARLVTIVGPAGVGKTRTAVQLAREATSALDEEQYMVDLADVRHPDAVAQAIASSVRATSPDIEVIAQRLTGRRVLVVLDNADHVLGALAIAASGLLAHAPALRLLVTSREPLRVPGEREVVLRPFGPAETEDAWRLFSERAADVRGGAEFDDAEEDDARMLCAELDGIPLALELAASRLDVLDVGTVRAGLGAWSSDGRHGSVQSAIAWSFDLLDAAHQEFLVHAGRFAGPFTADAFAGVLGIDRDTAEAALRTLVGKSLLSPQRSDTGRPRLRMLESTREFVAARDDGGDAADWAARHRRWFADLVWSLAPTLRSFEARDTMAVLDGFRADIDLALDSSLAEGDRASALLLTAGLAQYWHLRGRFQEGRARIDAALALPAGPADGGRTAAALALPVAELELANLTYQLGDPAAGFVAIAGAQEHGREVGDASTTAVALARAAYGHAMFGDMGTARQLLGAARESAAAAAPWARSEVALCEGQMLRHSGDPSAAIASLQESYRVASSIGYTWMVTSSRYLLAKSLVDARRPREAIEVARTSAEWARTHEDAAAGLALLHVAAGACAAVERHEIGARLFGAVDALGVRYGYSTETAEGEDATRLRAAVAAGLAVGEFEREYRNGRDLGWEDVMALVDRLPRSPFADEPARAAATTPLEP